VAKALTDRLLDRWSPITVPRNVYAPQEDSALLTEALRATDRVRGSRVADLCAGSGVVALAAAAYGAASVTAFEMSAPAVDFARANAAAAGLDVRVHHGSWSRAEEFRPYDVVACNPPYLPFDEHAADCGTPVDAGPDAAWNAGPDGRALLDPLCDRAPTLLSDGGTILIVQSEFADIDRTVTALRSAGLTTEIVAERCIPFGLVLTARAGWLERIGLLEAGRRESVSLSCVGTSREHLRARPAASTASGELHGVEVRSPKLRRSLTHRVWRGHRRYR
jgi:release factor glutamine methyltransferase